MIDTDILEELRADEPGKSDRELLEDLALRKLGLRTRLGNRLLQQQSPA